jgi:ATP-binding cassette subfamily C protein LapB
MMPSGSPFFIGTLFKQLLPVFREVAMLSLVVNVLALAVPIFILQVYDRVVFHAGISTLYGLVFGMAVVIVFDFILRQARARILQTAAVRVDVDVSRYLFDKIMAVPLPVLESRPAAYWQSLFRDVDIVRGAFSGTTALLICDLPFVFLFVGVAYVIAPSVIWVLAIVLPIYIILALRSGHVASVAAKAERDSLMGRDTLLAEIITGRTTVKALSLEQALRPQWEAVQTATIERAIERGAKADDYANIGITLTMFTTVAMTSVGAIAILEQKLTIGALIAANMLSTRLLGTANQLVGAWRGIVAARHSAKRLNALFAMEEERQTAAVHHERPAGQIMLEDVTFSYGTSEDRAPVVRNLSLDLPRTGLHGLIGPNGSGKSTILKLIQGLYTPDSGTVLLDGADVRQFTRRELASWIGYVPQECRVFAGTVRDNIAQRVPDAADSEIVAAAKAAGAHTFISALPGGYSAEIGEAGQRFSAGERQRLAIARALIGDPALLCLDEPSSNLDRQTELDLRATLVEMGKTRSVVIVTHSPVLLSGCQTIIALNAGRVVRSGRAEEMLATLFGTPVTSTASDSKQPNEAPADDRSVPSKHSPSTWRIDLASDGSNRRSGA